MTGFQVQAEVLGKLLVAQQFLDVLPAKEEKASFMRQALKEIPGVADVHFCFQGLLLPGNAKYQPVHAQCGLDWEQLPRDISQQCCALEQLGVHCIALRTAHSLYGFMIISLENAEKFSPYEPYLVNMANAMAILMEKRELDEKAQKTLLNLEHQVALRTADLSRRNLELQEEIQQRKQLEEALSKAREESEARVRERTAELVQTNRALQRQISERQRVEKALRLSERRLHSIVSTAVDGIIVLDAQGQIEFFNPAAEELFGCAAEQVMGRHIRMLMPASYSERYIDSLFRLDGEGQSVHKEAAGLRKNSSTFPMELTVSEMQCEMVRKFTVIVRDITERKQAEAEHKRVLRQAEEERRRAEALAAEAERRWREAEEGRSILEALMEHIPEGITIADAPDVRIRKVSNYGRQMAGRSREALEGIPVERHVACWGLLRSDGITSPSGEELPLTRAVKQGEVVTEEEWVLQRPDGGKVPLLCNAGPIRDKEGRITGGVIAWRDITERKRVEEALKQADRRKNEFLATLGHELRNPLAPIRMAVQILRLHQDQLDHRLCQTVDLIDRQAQHMTRLVDDLLDVARIVRGRIQLQKETVELSDVIARAVETIKPLMDTADHQFILTLPEQPIRLKADSVRLAQVISNLLHNAVKYTQPGGKIELIAEGQGEEAIIRVRDNGVGIAAEMLPRIFDMFAQADHSPNYAPAGLGLGLTLTQRLVKMHRGSIQAMSEGRGRGSEFIVRLPKLAEAEQEAAPSADKVLPEARARRVLVVDDNADVAASLTMLLEMMGHKVRSAHAGAEALEIVPAFAPDLALIDIGLPGMSGHEVARRLRVDYPPGKLKLIAMTGFGRDEDRLRSEQAGFDHHLLKPVEIEMLETLLRS